MAIPHIGFILAAYGLTGVVLGTTIVVLVRDQRRLRRLLAGFEPRPEERR